MGTEQDVAELLLKCNAIVLRPANPFKFASGILSPIYCDNRLLLSLPSERKTIIDFFVRSIKVNKLDADVIAGIATASIPWAALIAEKLGKPMIYIRKEAKDHGKENLIEGTLKKGQKVLVIEDLVSTGGSSLAAVDAARNGGGVVNDCLAIFSYEMDSAKKGFKAANCRLYSLCNFSALAKVAVEKGYIKKDDLHVVLDWSKNPKAWGV